MPDQKDSGSFVTGFGMGLVTGAAAYFLFATEQGKELRNRVLEEWESAEETITKEAGVELPKRLRQLMTEAVGYFAESIREVQELQENAEESLKSGVSKAKKALPKRTGSKFKGL